MLHACHGKKIDLQIERKDTPYSPPKVAAKPFCGEGKRLGEIEAVVSGSGKVGVKYGQESPQSSSRTGKISGYS